MQSDRHQRLFLIDLDDHRRRRTPLWIPATIIAALAAVALCYFAGYGLIAFLEQKGCP